jgi:hypothetical protein
MVVTVAKSIEKFYCGPAADWIVRMGQALYVIPRPPPGGNPAVWKF